MSTRRVLPSAHERTGPSTGGFAALCLSLPVSVLVGCDGGSSGPATAALDTLMPVNGTELYVHTEGAGDPMMIVHGGPILDHGYLTEPLRPLADDYRLVFYDQRLSGRSAGSVDTSTVGLAAFVADIEAIRQELGLERIHLLGHSWGGLVAMNYALTHPDRLRSLILVSPMAPSTRLWQSSEVALQATIEPADTAGLGELGASPELAAREPAAVERMLQLSFRSQLHDRRLAEQLRFHIADDYARRSEQFGHMIGELSSYDLVDELATLDVPTLLVYGGSEIGATIGGDVLARTIPDIRVESIPEAAHFAFLERPRAFHRVLQDFLSGLE